MSNNILNLPTSVEALKNTLRTGIEFYQGSPVKNENKLNEALAKALCHKNYDTLSALIASLESEPVIKAKHTILIDDENNSFIDGQLINPDFFDEQEVEYSIRTKDELVDDLFSWIGDASGNDREMMIEDLKMLVGSDFANDTYVLTSCNTNHYLSANSGALEFDKFCEEVLELNKSFNSIPRCSHCHSDFTEEDSVDREYYDKDSEETVYIRGRYVGEDQFFESDEDLPHGRFDCHDGSDTCAKCDVVI